MDISAPHSLLLYRLKSLSVTAGPIFKKLTMQFARDIPMRSMSLSLSLMAYGVESMLRHENCPFRRRKSEPLSVLSKLIRWSKIALVSSDRLFTERDEEGGRPPVSVSPSSVSDHFRWDAEYRYGNGTSTASTRESPCVTNSPLLRENLVPLLATGDSRGPLVIFGRACSSRREATHQLGPR